MVKKMTLNDIPKNPEQRWEFIKYQLRLRGSSITQLARDMGLHDRTVRFAKQNRYPRVERRIAKTLGVTPWFVWPERWNNDGTPVRERPNAAERKHTSANNSSKIQSAHRSSCAEV